MQKSATVRLISLDFDGTILSYDHPDGVLHPEIIEILNTAGKAGVSWCANSGRDCESQRAVIERSVGAGLKNLPAAYICCESMVYLVLNDDVVSLEPWNTQARQNLLDCHARVQKHLGARLDQIEINYKPLITAVGDLMTSYLLDQKGEGVFALYRELESSLAHMEDVNIIRNGGWVAVNHRDLGKGNALKAYAGHAGVPLAQVLAIGDHHNDLTMLRGDTAAHVGCPGDAIPEVRDAVKKAGGMVGSLAGPAGTAEVIRMHVLRDYFS
jgi:hydroxymethylpyrimidine pyrophosphatase-like HAD family hydrolase